MQLAILIAVVCALAQSESVIAEPVGGSLWRAALTLAGALVAPLAAALGSLGLARGLAKAEPPSAAECQRVWSRVQSAVVALWLAVVAATMYIVQWPRVVRVDWSLGAWPLVDEILILIPVLIPLVLLWSVMHHLQWTAHRAAARVRGDDAPPSRLLAFLWHSARHHLALVVLPALVVIGLQESLVRLWPRLEANPWWLYVPLLAGMLVMLPVALRRIWRTSPLPTGELRDQLVSVCRKQNVAVREILVWNTDFQMANAAVAGVMPGLRYVFLSDGLLARLTAEEVESVVRHELGHVTGRHMLLRMLVLALPLALWMAAEQVVPGAGALLSEQIAGLGMSRGLQQSLLVPMGLAAYAIAVVGSYSKWLEHDADLSACTRADGTLDRVAAQTFARTLVKIVGRSPESRWTLWLHPSMPVRLAVIALAVADPRSLQGFRRRLVWAAWGLGAAYVTVTVASLARAVFGPF